MDPARENADASDKLEALLKTPCYSVSYLNSWPGSKEEIAFAKEIDKATKSSTPTPLLRGVSTGSQRGFSRVQPYSYYNGNGSGITCYECGRLGHIACNCRSKKGRYFR